MIALSFLCGLCAVARIISLILVQLKTQLLGSAEAKVFNITKEQRQ
jgi:hypothetical protein